MLRRAITVLTAAGLAVAPLALGGQAARAATGPSFTSSRSTITSFDGTPIVYNLFEPKKASAKPAPKKAKATPKKKAAAPTAEVADEKSEPVAGEKAESPKKASRRRSRKETE